MKTIILLTIALSAGLTTSAGAVNLTINGKLYTRDASSGGVTEFTQVTPNVVSAGSFGPSEFEYRRVGVLGTFSAGSRRRLHPIFFFRLPTVVDSNDIVSASASITTTRKADSPSFNLDLWGLGYSTTGIIDAEWRLFGNTDTNAGIGIPDRVKIEDNWITPSTPGIPGPSTVNLTTHTMSGTANSSLVAFLKSLYDAGAKGGDLAIFRLNPDVFLVPESGGTPGYSFLVDAVAPPTISCAGFEPPMDNGPVTVKKNRALPLKAGFLDEGGNPITDTNIVSLPVIQVLFDSELGESPVDVTGDAFPEGHGTDGNQFEFDTSTEKWQFNLKTKNYDASGAYTITVDSGDDFEYVIDPTCTATFVVE